MSLLSRLFKSKAPAAPTLEERIAALTSADSEELLACAQGDNIDALRIAAIALLPFSTALKDLALNHTSDSVKRAAQIRLGQLFEAAAIDMASLINGVANTQQQLLLTQFSAKASLEVIGQIDDSQALLDLAVDAAVASVRQAAADRILDFDTLGQLLKSSKNKDKAVYKLVKSKLDQHKAQNKKAAELSASAATLCESAELLSRVEGDQSEKIEQLQRRWKALQQQGELNAAAQSRFNEALARHQQQLDDEQAAVDAVLKAQTDASDAEAARVTALAAQQQALAAETVAMVAAPLVQVNALLADIYNSDNFSPDTTASFATALKLSRNQIDELATEAMQSDVVQQFVRLHQDTTATLQLCAEQGSVAELNAKLCGDNKDDTDSRDTAARALDKILRATKHLPESHSVEIIVQARTALNEHKTAQKALKQEQDSQRRKLSDLLRRGLHAVEDNNLRRVAGISRDVEKLAPALAPLPAGMASKVEDLATGLAKLRDWHSFATEPKKQALLSQMEALIGSSLHPADLASHVQRLQDEWKSLSKGGKSQDEDLWQKFQTVANKVYEPCHEHFDDLAKVRDENLAKRKMLLEQLQNYIASNDWNTADWRDDNCKAVEQLRQLAREEWRRYSPVARNLNQELQQSFEQYLDTISASIDAYLHIGKAAKQQLITQAEQLASGDDNSKAIDGIKRLQAQWKNAGRCNHKDDRKLWSDFRAHCDSVFTLREQQFAAQDIEQTTNQVAAEAVIAALEKLQALNGQEFLDDAHNVDELNQQYYAIGNLPRATRAKLSTQFKQLSETLSNKGSIERQQIKDQAWQAIFSASDSVRDFEWQKIDVEHAKETLEAASNNCPSVAKVALQAIQQRFNTPASDINSQQKNEAKLLQLCLRAEILTRLDTPEAYKAERMQYQITQMSQGLGQVEKIDADSPHTYTLEWLSIGAGLESSYASLWQRFNLCLDAMKKS